MSDFKWFLFCIFSFILLIIGLSFYEYSIHDACIMTCYAYSGEFCNSKCHEYYGSISYAAGIAFMVLGSIIVLISFPVVTGKLTNKLPDNTTNAGAELTEVVEVVDTDESITLQEKLKAQTAQIQALTERLRQYETLQQESSVQ